MKTRRKPRIQKAPLQRLARIAIRRWNTDASWDAISELRSRGSPQTLELARSLYTSRSWRRRAVGMYIASQMWRRERGRYEKYAVDSSHELLFAGIRDPHPEVIRAAATGFAHRHHDGALNDLVRLATHASDSVRWSIAFALSGYVQPAAIDALLHLMTDHDDDVRDYATWALSKMYDEADTPEIRAALWRNVNDNSKHVRNEALDGLVGRSDPGVVPYLIPRLTPDCHVYELSAAEQLADPALLDALLALDALGRASDSADAWSWLRQLHDAIAACQPKQD